MGVPTFATSLAFTATAFFLCAYVPAVNFNAVAHVFFPALVFAPAYVYGAVVVWKWRATHQPIPTMWAALYAHDPKALFYLLGLVGCIVYVLVVLLYAWWFSEANWGGIMAKTPCGASSCTSQTNVALAYNARGFFPWKSVQYADFRPTICGYDASACRWADSNGRKIVGYPPIAGTGYPDLDAPPCDGCGLATNRTWDYPNLAVGVDGGMYMGFNVSLASDATLCPGNRLVDGEVVGQAPCFYCYPYWATQLAYADAAHAYCPVPLPYEPLSGVPEQYWAQNDYVWCGGTASLCLPPQATRTPYSTAMIFKYALLNLFLPILMFVVNESLESCYAEFEYERERARAPRPASPPPPTPQKPTLGE